MWFLKMADRLDPVTGGNGFLCALALIGGGLLLIVAVVACLCKSGAIYAGFAVMLVGGLESGFFATDTAVKTAAFFRGIAWVAVGALGLLIAGIIALARRRDGRKKRLLFNPKDNGGWLPEKDNSYVRARLHTALRADSDGTLSNERKSVPYENRGTVRLGYARRLLAGIQDAPLSPAERLETETLASSFAEYAACESWSAEQLRAVNELFSRLLKLAAKYSVGE